MVESKEFSARFLHDLEAPPPQDEVDLKQPKSGTKQQAIRNSLGTRSKLRELAYTEAAVGLHGGAPSPAVP